MTDSEVADPFAHLKQRASERADRTVERLRAGVAFLKATGRKITAESIKHITRELEPDFAGLSFQVIRRNPRAYALYRAAADAFNAHPTPENNLRKRTRRRLRGSARGPRSSYDPLQRLDRRELVRRIRELDAELGAALQRHSAQAYDQQMLLAKILRLETELILLQAGQSDSN